MPNETADSVKWMSKFGVSPILSGPIQPREKETERRFHHWWSKYLKYMSPGVKWMRPDLFSGAQQLEKGAMVTN